MTFDTIITSTLVSSILLGFGAFLGKVWINRIRESDRGEIEDKIRELQLRFDFILHTSKSTFEKEFAACEETWNSVLKLVSEIRYLKSDFDNGSDLHSRLQSCYEQHLTTHDILFNNAPFHSEKIRDTSFELGSALEKVYKGTQDIIDEKDFDELFPAFYKDRWTEISPLIHAFEKEIRKRFVTMNSQL